AAASARPRRPGRASRCHRPGGRPTGPRAPGTARHGPRSTAARPSPTGGRTRPTRRRAENRTAGRRRTAARRSIGTGPAPSASLVLFHGRDETLRPHVRPVLVDVVEAGLPGVLAVRDGPPGGNVDERRPEGVLPLVVDEHEVAAVGILERVGHGSRVSFNL